jgi:energy-coupling factor transport system ATP-binding protein
VEIAVSLLGAGDNRCADLPYNARDALAEFKARGLLGPVLRGSAAAAAATALDAATTATGVAAVRGKPLISVRDLRFSYPDSGEALGGVSLDLFAGELLAVVGRNGAGKSTLSKLLVGLLKPSGGVLELFGKNAKAWKIHELAERVSLVFQNPEHQFLTDSVREEIVYSLSSKGVEDPAEIKRRTDEALDRMELGAFADAHPFALSAGMKRRLGVATMLVGNPQVLIVDEPTYGQDARMTRTLMAVLDEFRAKGVSIVMITHDMRLVQEYADRVVVLNEGRIRYDGEAAKLFDHGELLSQARLRPTILQDLLSLYQAGGGTVEGSFRKTGDFIAALEPQTVSGASNVR